MLSDEWSAGVAFLSIIYDNPAEVIRTQNLLVCARLVLEDEFTRDPSGMRRGLYGEFRDSGRCLDGLR
jgi:hypothetical protein